MPGHKECLRTHEEGDLNVEIKEVRVGSWFMNNVLISILKIVSFSGISECALSKTS